MRHRFLALAFAVLASSVALAVPSVNDVEQAVQRGDYASAERMTREVIAARPDSAKAHYIYAELLAHDGDVADARAEAERAHTLDPAIKFTSPDRFREFEASLQNRRSSVYPGTNVIHPSQGSGSGGWLLLIVGIGIVWFVVSLFRRARYAMNPGYQPAVGYPPGVAPYGPSPPYGTPGGGIGSTVGAGLGGLAAGMLLERALDDRHDERVEYIQAPSDPQINSADPDRGIDFGNGNDWGGDSGGGGFDSGGGGFDSGGGGSDWS